MSLQLTLTDEEVIQGLRAAVERKGVDYSTNGSCQYFHGNGHPSCLVGHVLYDHGVRLSTIEPDKNGTPVSTLIRLGLLKVSEHAAEVLDLAQTSQDAGLPWGQALDLALYGLADNGYNLADESRRYYERPGEPLDGGKYDPVQDGGGY